MNDEKHIHLIGICGTAMASLAGMLKQRGFHVTGSDAAAYPPMSDFLARLGIPVAQPFDAKQSGAAARSGRRRQCHLARQSRAGACARSAHSVLLAAAIAARRISARKEVLVVAGTHGKTTTTRCWRGFSIPPGSQPSLSDRRHCRELWFQLSISDEGKHFILEGDEYDTAFFDKGPKFLHYFPDAVILTSVEFDHADIYKDLDAVKTAFKRLVNLVPRRGRIVAFDGAPAMAPKVDSLECCLSKRILSRRTLWRRRRGNWRITNLTFECRREPRWTVLRDGQPWADFEFPLAGEYNVWNATAAAAMAADYGISTETYRGGAARLSRA